MEDLAEGRGKRGPKPRGVAVRFWENVNVKEADECWEWTGYFTKAGYGDMSICNQHWLAHRISYMLNVGPADKNKYVMHKCDNPKCVNPNHLSLGTPKDNTVDAISKGRALVGNKNGMSKLSADDVTAIRIRRSYGEKLKSIAESYGVNVSCINKIIHRQRWSHIQ